VIRRRASRRRRRRRAPDDARAGGKDAEKLPEALAEAERLIRAAL
jgi:hypothetical protein